MLGRVAQDLGLTTLWQPEPPTSGSLTLGKFPSQWMVVAREARDLGGLTTDARWGPPVVAPSTPLWTDDFSNILSVLVWRGNVERSRPMTLEDSIHSQRLRVLREAERLGNVSEACRRHGLSRTLFYRLRKRFERVWP